MSLMLAPASYAIDDGVQGVPEASLVIHTAQTDIAAQAQLSPAQAERYHHLIELYRCPKCQNANLAGSDAPIAQDLKHKILLMVQANQSDNEIRDYLVTRYGAFISYQPVVTPATWLLWFLPPVLLLLGLLVWVWRLKRRPLTTPPLSSEEQWRLAQLLNQLPTANGKETDDDRK
jgi:cytochrome c-type biogenesis protein CcmH